MLSTVLLTRVRRRVGPCFLPLKSLHFLSRREGQLASASTHRQLILPWVFQFNECQASDREEATPGSGFATLSRGSSGSPARVVLAPLLEDVAYQLPLGGPVDSDIPPLLFTTLLASRGDFFVLHCPAATTLGSHDDEPTRALQDFQSGSTVA